MNHPPPPPAPSSSVLLREGERETLLGTPLFNGVLDEIQGHLQSFLERFIIDEGSNYEVEAKFGIFIDRGTEDRISLPIMNTSVLASGDWYRFEANLSAEQHKAFNELLNNQVRQNPKSWKYRHEKTIDTLYTSPQRRKIRVSRDIQTGRILHVLEKRRIADLALHIPASPFDVRISINTETKVPGLTEESLKDWPSELQRSKDRISYEYDHFIQVDLTQVRQKDGGGNGVFGGGGGHPAVTTTTTTKHELELEIINTTKQLSDQGLALRFLCNILDLARHSFG